MRRATLISLVLLSSCRSDRPPLIEPICILDGFGGGDCVMSDGSQKYMSPSELKNHWATSQTSQANFAAWCYGVPPKTANAALEVIKRSTLPTGE